MHKVVMILFCTLIIGCTSGSHNNTRVTVHMEETSEAFKNPLKGFRPTRRTWNNSFVEHEYASLYKHYIKYTDLETRATDSVQTIIDWSNKAWAGIEHDNIKVVPRVVIVYPTDPNGGEAGYWPEGIPHGDPVNQWLSEELRMRLPLFIEKLGQAWDNDPRVAAVEIGLWGRWGEHHIWPHKFPDGSSRIPSDLQNTLGDAYSKAFRHKKLMVRYPETFTNYHFGYFWDSFGLPDDMASGLGIIDRDVWRTQMISGEPAYNWGDQSKLGGRPNGTLSSDSNTDYMIEWIHRMHASSLGWIAEYEPKSEIVLKNAAKMQKAFGYRYVIRKVVFTSRARRTLDVKASVENIGAAPMYYQWPVELSLLNADREVVWKSTFNTDITQWLPGLTIQIEGKFDVSGLAEGTYILALAVVDPAGNTPSLRFANVNYYAGGRTPVGKLGIGQDPADQSLLPFDSLKEDKTLCYVVEQ